MGAIFGSGVDDFSVFFILSVLGYFCLCCGCRLIYACCCFHMNRRRRRRNNNNNIVSSVDELPHPIAKAVIVKHDPDEVAEAWYYEDDDDDENEDEYNDHKNRNNYKKHPTHTISYHDENNNLVAVNIYDSVEKAMPICVVHSSSHGRGIVPRELQSRLGTDLVLP